MGMLCVHVEVDSAIRPKTQSASKTYAVLMDIDLDAIDVARKSAPFEERRVTVNDFMLTVITEALSRFVATNDDRYGQLDSVIDAGAVVSMNVRDPLSTAIDNRFGVGEIILPICSAQRISFEAKLIRIKNQMDTVKARQYALYSSSMMEIMGYLPALMISLLMRLQNSAVIMSNINGPRDTLYLGGNRVLSAAGVVQNHHGVSLSFCIAGYDGTCSVSLLADSMICGGKRSAKDIMSCVREVLAERGCVQTLCTPRA